MADKAHKTDSDTEAQQIPEKSLLEKNEHISSEAVTRWTIGDTSTRLRDPRYRSKLIRSWLIAGAFFCLGITDGLTGATLLDLQIVTGTDLEKASAFVTGFNGGFMAGCLVCGVIYSQVKFNLQLFLTVAALGAVSIVTPYCSSYPLMILMRVVCGFFAGGINTIGTAAHMQIWGNDGKVLMQIIHFCFAVGGAISPLYSEPFLAQRASVNETTAENVTKGNNLTVSFFPTSDHESTNVHYTFILSGVFMFVGSLSFLVLFVSGSKKDKQDANMEDIVIQRKLPLSLHLFLLIMVCTFFMFYCCVEISFPFFLVPFLVNQYDFMTKAHCVYITVIFWASFAVSRFAMIFVSHFFSAARLLFLCLTVMMVAFTGFYISAAYSAISTLSVFTAIAGLGMSGIYAAAFSWTESELLKVTAKVSSSICILSSLGTIFNPLLLGFLMEGVSNMWFCHLIFGLALVTYLMFIFLLLFNRYFVNKHYSSLDSLRKTVLVENAQIMMPGNDTQ